MKTVGFNQKRSAAQNERQKDEHRERGKYAKVNPCYVCEKSAGVNYFSHPLTDTRDSEGMCFGDLALCLCARCATATDGITTVREFLQYMQKRLGDQCPSWVGRRLDGLLRGVDITVGAQS